MATSLKTQNWRVWRHLKLRGPLTSLQALNRLGVARLASRVYDLRRDGWKIVSDRVTVKTRAGLATVAKYSLVTP